MPCSRKQGENMRPLLSSWYPIIASIIAFPLRVHLRIIILDSAPTYFLPPHLIILSLVPIIIGIPLN